MKVIKKGIIAIVFIICFMLVYVVFVYGSMFLFPQKESFVPSIEIIREDINNHQDTEQDMWYRVQDTIPLEWNFSYVNEKAYFISQLGTSIVNIKDGIADTSKNNSKTTSRTDIVMVDSIKIDAGKEQHLIAYEVGIVDIYTATLGKTTDQTPDKTNDQIKKTNSINISNIIILAKFIGSDIFILSLNYDFQPEVFWFRENDDGNMKQVGHIKMEKPFQYIGKAIATAGVGMFVHIDDGIVLFDSKTMKYARHYEFVSLENVLGNSEFYVIEYTRGNTTVMDIYVDEKRVFTFHEDNINTPLSDVRQLDVGQLDVGQSNVSTSDIGQLDFSTSAYISLYEVAKQKKIYKFKKGSEVFSVKLP